MTPELITVVIGIGFVVIAVLIVRAFGAWMFRINEVIDELKKINEKL